MIHNLLPIVGEELNDYFKSKFDINEDRVIVSNLINQDGSIAVEGNNKVVFHLVNIEEETTLKASSGTNSYSGGFGSSGGNINLNITVMFSAFFTGKNYVEALKFLSSVIYFFQSKPVFTQSNTPGLTSNIEKVVFDIISLEPRDLNSIFSMMGAKYMPSVIYRVRMLTFSSDNIDDVIPAISGIGINEDDSLEVPPSQSRKSGPSISEAFDSDKI
tara:strand:+ start:1264 stop:1911 length:648 start_codon:yes stop_codon:yes gene_type:complete